MLQLTHTKVPTHVRPRRRTASVAVPRAEARATPIHSNAAPTTLAAIVVLGLLLAVTMALVGALGA